jgi:hypothetical protein
MQNKFKSELAKTIAEKRRLWTPRQLGVLVAAIAACALMVGGSALSLPISAKGAGESPIDYETLISWEADYLVPGVVDVDGVPTDMLTHVGDWGSTYSVMRTVNLKADSFLTPGAIYAKQYSKWTYTTNVKLQDISMLPTVMVTNDVIDPVTGEVTEQTTTEVVAMKLGVLEIYDVEEATLYPVGWGISLNGIELTTALASYAVAVQVDGVMTIEITLPQGSYVNGDEVSIFVQYRAYMDWSSSTAEGISNFNEEAFPEFADYVAPVV